MEGSRTMQERQLTNLFIQMGLERGMEIEAVVDELARSSLPSFVDSRAFRESLIDAAEDQLRLQVDERVNKLRQQVGQESQIQGRVNRSLHASPPPAEDKSHAASSDPSSEAPEAGEPDTFVVDEDLPSDATTIWRPCNE